MAGRQEQVRKFKQDRGCGRCPYNGCAAALDFHHIDPDSKSFAISNRLNYSLKRVIAEIAKCCLLCSNCHREYHAGEFEQLPPAIADDANNVFVLP